MNKQLWTDHFFVGATLALFPRNDSGKRVPEAAVALRGPTDQTNPFPHEARRPAIFGIGPPQWLVAGLSLDARWSSFGAYFQGHLEKLDAQWKKTLEINQPTAATRAMVSISYRLTAEGKITHILTTSDPSPGGWAEPLCLDAIKRVGDFPPWSAEMIQLLGREQELTVGFILP